MFLTIWIDNKDLDNQDLTVLDCLIITHSASFVDTQWNQQSESSVNTMASSEVLEYLLHNHPSYNLPCKYLHTANTAVYSCDLFFIQLQK